LNGEEFATGQQPPAVPVENWGVVSIDLVVTTTEGCSDTATESAFVAPLPLLEIDTTPTCEGVAVTIQNGSSSPDGSALNYTWNDGQGNSFNTNNLSTTYGQFGQYTITLTAENAAGCNATTSIQQVVYATPQADFDWENVSFCALGSTSLTDISTLAEGVISAWNWSANGTQFGQTPDIEFSAPDFGIYSITLEVVSNEGCSDAVTYTDLVEVYPNPQAGFVISPDPPISAAPYFFLTDRSNGADAWEYLLSDGSTYNTASFDHELSMPGIFSITQIVTNSFGCTDTLTVEYDLEPELLVYVPNAFTPDADGLNEVFKPVISGATLQSYRFFIVDRWGETVFDTTDRNAGWIGDFRGGDHFVMGGAYVWQLEVSTVEKRIKQVYTGHVTIIR
jgi:gliding motility-associated-like protein